MNAHQPIDSDEPASQRRKRVAELVALPTDVAERDAVVLALLADEDYGVRREGVLAVCRMVPLDEIAACMVGALNSASVGQRSAILDVFVRHRDAALVHLAPLLLNREEGVRRFVVDTLGAIGTTATVELLRTALADPHPSVAAAAIEGLARAASAEQVAAIAASVLGERRHALVSLSALLVCDRLRIRLPDGVVLAFIGDPVTSHVAFRLLGRAGIREPILAALVSGRRQELRCALAGLAELILADPISTRAALRARRLPIDEIESMLVTLDRTALMGALALGALLQNFSVIERVLSRDDIDRMWPSIESVMACFAGTGLGSLLCARAQRLDSSTPNVLGERLRALSFSVPDVIESRATPGVPHISALDDDTFSRLVDICASRGGVVIEKSARARIEARLEPRLRALGLTSFEDYVARLQGRAHDDELLVALAAVTIHETYLYREPKQLDALRREIVPMLSTRGPTHVPFLVWSAGCSTGEEAWSIAMILDEARSLRRRSYRVVGTDLSAACIEEARAGRYGHRSLRGEVPSTLRARGMRSIDEATIEMSERLRPHVTFDVENLLQATPAPESFDVIVCRNVLIYLTRAAREHVIATFHAALRPGGVLLLGHSESLLYVDTDFRFVSLDHVIVYLKSLPDGTTPFAAGQR
jgi:chemotaxis protein methyltransferase CheR